MPRRKASLGQGYILDGVGIEHREETEQVGCIVYGHTVHEDQVLIGPTAPHVDTAAALISALYARKQLNDLQHIHLTE